MTIRENDSLHRSSPWIFLVSFGFSVIAIAISLNIAIPEKSAEKIIEAPPVVILVQNIPETHQQKTDTAPPKPFTAMGSPLEVLDSVTLDDIAIEEPKVNVNNAVIAPPAVFVPRTDSKEEEKGVYEYFEVEEIPQKIKNIVPEYPEMARRAGIEGTVTLKVLVNEKGAVDSVEVIDGPPAFRKNSVQAAKSTVFKPAKYNDRAVACWVIMPFRFKLSD